MKKIAQELDWFLHQKIYVAALALTAVCSYGFAITHHAIGVDDTVVELYWQDGVGVVVGRWLLFLVDKLFHMSEFSPFMLEFLGALFLMLGATLFAVLFRRLLGDSVGIGGYTVFACLLLSNPIISEVYVFYGHNAAGLGYVLTPLSLLAFLEMLERTEWKEKLLWTLASVLLLWAALGCYESFAVVYLIGVLIVLFLRGMGGQGVFRTRQILTGALLSGVILILGMVLRSVVISLITVAFSLDEAQAAFGTRNVSEMLVFFGGSEQLYDLVMLLKRYWLIFFVNAIVYHPVTGYVLSSVVWGAASVVVGVRKKSLWYPLFFVGMMLVPILLAIFSAEVPHYRSCQYIPFFTASGALILYLALTKNAGKWRRGIVLAVSAVLIYNQAEEMNRNFYIDYQKYEDAKATMLAIAYELERDYGNEIPILITGQYEVPYPFIESYYVSYDSKEFRWIARISDLVDEQLKEKYYTPHGYGFAGEAQRSVIDWGVLAFTDSSTQLNRFLEMHGHTFPAVTDREQVLEGRALSFSMPEWPEEGSIIQMDGYILIHL